jgi:hypothetical protein
MESTAITTVIKMMETLPEKTQNLVAEHIREYIATVQDENAWDSAFHKTQSQLASAARTAKQQIAAGQAKPIDYKHLWSRLRCLRFGMLIKCWMRICVSVLENPSGFGLIIPSIRHFISNASILKKMYGQDDPKACIMRYLTLVEYWESMIRYCMHPDFPYKLDGIVYTGLCRKSPWLCWERLTTHP